MTTSSTLPAGLPVEFRVATREDIGAIVTLVTSAYRGEASRAGWTTEADLLDGQRIDAEAVAAIVEKPASRVLLAENDGRLLACCHVEKQDDGCYFGMFAVDPVEQGSGIGKIVLAEAERVARQDFGCARMQMTVISLRDELIAWY
ncbi:MAG: GNAT family N-acetyltransferase, partial [Proteobacteria bacterium]|nr:GNAT family N-acetyltransferase [Pseudomonadota bacterium]